MKYKVEVIADSSGKWMGNGMEFDSQDAAEEYAKDLYQRWTMVTDWRVVDGSGDVKAVG